MKVASVKEALARMEAARERARLERVARMEAQAVKWKARAKATKIERKERVR